jgi:hypothetical protein
MLLIVDVRTGASPVDFSFLLGAGRCFARGAAGRLSGEVRRGKGARRLAASPYRFTNAGRSIEPEGAPI